MFSVTDPVKAVALNRAYIRKNVDGSEHITIQNKSGSVVHLYPDKGIGRTLLNTTASNDYFYSNYSTVSGCYYYWNQDGLDFVEYNPITGEKNFYNLHRVAGFAYFSQSQFHARYPIIPYGGFVSTDGNVYFGGYMVDAIFGYIKFNVTTKEFESHQANPDPEFTHIYMRNRSNAFYIDSGSLAGVYSSYIWTEAADNYTHLRDTIVAEIATSGLSWPNSQVIYLHQDDRELVSATRRIFTPIGSGNTWKIIDIKNPSTWITTQRLSSVGIHVPKAETCLDQTGTPVDTTNYTFLVLLYDLATEAGLTVPSLPVGIAYSTPRFVGRFLYVGHFYLGNNTYTYNFLIHPDTNKAVYTYSFNKYTDYVTCSYRDYKCNFGGLFGFSSDDEIVRFLTDNTFANYYFFRPDTKVFQAYNPITDPDGYVIRRVFLDDISDPDGLGYSIGTGVELVIDDVDYYTDELTPGSKIALAAIYEQELVANDIADVTYRVLVDKDISSEIFDIKIKNLYVNSFALTQALVIDVNKIVALGEVYSGASFIELAGEVSTLKRYLGGTISGNGAIKAGDFVLLYGYSGGTNVFDVSDWDNIQKFNLPTLATNEVTYATNRPEGVLAIGIASRSVAHFKGCAFTLINPTARTVTNITDLFPNEFKFTSSRNLRSALGLTNATYPDGAVETQVQAYMASQSLTRAQVIALFKDTCRWHGADVYTYGTKTVVGLAYEGVLGLAGIRIEETVSSGVWIDRDFYENEGGKALLIDTTDILNLQPSEIKPVQFNLTPNVQSMGRVAGSTNYLAFIVNDASYDGIIRIVSKTAFETAANGSGIITTIPTIVTIDFGGIAGYGFGDADDFDQYDTHCSNAYFCEGDDLYITCRSNVIDAGLYPCIIKVDLATGSSEVFAKSATRATRAISYDGTRMLITNGTSLVINDNFTSQVGSITI